MSAEMQERIDRMRERAATKPRSFQFTDDQPEFVGNFLRWEQSPPHPVYGSALLAIFAEVPSGEEVTLWLYHRVMRNALLRQAPQHGELVLIRRGDKVQPEGGGNSYFNYAVVIDRTDGGDGLSLEQAKNVARQQAGGIDDELDGVDPALERQAHEEAMAAAGEPDVPVDDEIPF